MSKSRQVLGRRYMSGFTPEEHAHCNKKTIYYILSSFIPFFFYSFLILLLATALWKKYSFGAVAFSFSFGIYVLLKEMSHEHVHHEPVKYPFLRIRTKDFPWENRKW